MVLYNTCLTIDSYYGLSEAQEMDDFSRTDAYRYEHEHRKWEYGLALRFARELAPKTVLNVGGGNSPLSVKLAREGMDVTEIDPTAPGKRFPEIKYIVEEFPVELLGKYDLVICTSVIEHVEHDSAFFRGLLDRTIMGAFLTTDFHPLRNRFSYAHYRTYNADDMFNFINMAAVYGMKPYGSIHYLYKEPMVYDYTFAALALKKT